MEEVSQSKAQRDVRSRYKRTGYGSCIAIVLLISFLYILPKYIAPMVWPEQNM